MRLDLLRNTKRTSQVSSRQYHSQSAREFMPLFLAFPILYSHPINRKADALFAIVSAASVAAKVTRDAWMERWIFSEPLPATEADRERGSGYPSDPKTQAYLRDSLDPTFGFPDIVRFSWTTVKNILDSRGHAVEWFAIRSSSD
jgi:ribonuclease HII